MRMVRRNFELGLRALGGIVAIYLVGRGVAEFFVINYGRSSSYRNHWGGPSLVGVLAVHSGPAAIVVGGTVVALTKRFRNRRRING